MTMRNKGKVVWGFLAGILVSILVFSYWSHSGKESLAVAPKRHRLDADSSAFLSKDTHSEGKIHRPSRKLKMQNNSYDSSVKVKQEVVIEVRSREDLITGIPPERFNIDKEIEGDAQSTCACSEGMESTFPKHQEFTTRENIDDEIDKLSFSPPVFLPNIKNPCWCERIRITYPFGENCIRQSIEGERRKKIGRALNNTKQEILADIGEGASTCRLRCLPYVYLVGVSKCGTTDLYRALMRHPQILHSVRKEFSYWNRIRYQTNQPGFGKFNANQMFVTAKIPCPVRQYVDVYDSLAQYIWGNRSETTQLITGDFSPNYLYDFDGWNKMAGNKGLPEPKFTVGDILHRLTPQAKIIIIVRNPADRLWSDYLFFLTGQNKTSEDFHNKVSTGINLFKECFQKRSVRACIYDQNFTAQVMPVRIHVGMYYQYIFDWLKAFPREQLYVIRLEDYSKGRMAVINSITNFLGISQMEDEATLNELKDLPPQNPKASRKARFIQMSNKTMDLIDEFYCPWNKKLATLLEDDGFLWNC